MKDMSDHAIVMKWCICHEYNRAARARLSPSQQPESPKAAVQPMIGGIAPTNAPTSVF